MRFEPFPSLSTANNDAVCGTLIVQTLLFVLASLILDGGQMAQCVLLACVVWWVGFLFILLRRPHTENRGDKIFLKLGFPILLVIAIASSPIWGWLRR